MADTTPFDGASMQAPSASAGFDRLARAITGRRRIEATDVLACRRAIYADGVIREDDAVALLRLHRRVELRDPAWDAFYVEALTDFFFWGRGDDSHIGEPEAAMLTTWLGKGRPGEVRSGKGGSGRNKLVTDPTELRLLLKLIYRSHGCPDALFALAMRSVEHSVMHCEQSVFGKGERRAGVVDEDDVEMIRKLVYGMAGGGGLRITADEAEFLFALNNRTRRRDNARSWQPLFVKAITMYLLFGGGSPGRIDAEEARWLIDHLLADPHDCANEQALLVYLRQEADWIDPALNAMFVRYGVG